MGVTASRLFEALVYVGKCSIVRLRCCHLQCSVSHITNGGTHIPTNAAKSSVSMTSNLRSIMRLTRRIHRMNSIRSDELRPLIFRRVRPSRRTLMFLVPRVSFTLVRRRRARFARKLSSLDGLAQRAKCRVIKTMFATHCGISIDHCLLFRFCDNRNLSSPQATRKTNLLFSVQQRLTAVT